MGGGLLELGSTLVISLLIAIMLVLAAKLPNSLRLFEPVAAIVETEGLTLVLPRTRADAAGLGYDSVFRRITLEVHSSLDAVGLTAAFSAALTEQGISANVVAGYFHDHLFVQADAAGHAIAALEALARTSREEASR